MNWNDIKEGFIDGMPSAFEIGYLIGVLTLIAYLVGISWVLGWILYIIVGGN
jgi:hypothetical protein